MKIVVPFKIDNISATFPQSKQFGQQWPIVRECRVLIAYPEFEEIAENEKRLGISVQSCQELKQFPIILITRVLQVGISNKYLAHRGNIYENQMQVKVMLWIGIGELK